MLSLSVQYVEGKKKVRSWDKYGTAPAVLARCLEMRVKCLKFQASEGMDFYILSLLGPELFLKCSPGESISHSPPNDRMQRVHLEMLTRDMSRTT